MSRLDVEMHFYTPKMVGVKYASSLGDGKGAEIWPNSKMNMGMYCELLLYMCFANRLMINWGMKDPRSGLIAERLERIAEDIQKKDYVYRYNGEIAEYEGAKAKHSFDINLEFEAEKGIYSKFKFHVKLHGFGMFDKSILYIPNDAVDVLAKYLDNKRSREEPYSGYLRLCAGRCAQLARQKALSMSNQGTLSADMINGILFTEGMAGEIEEGEKR
jgi:hypothetical protein